MILGRTTVGINKAEDDGRKDAHIWFAKALRGFFLRRWPAISHFVAGSAGRPCATEVQQHFSMRQGGQALNYPGESVGSPLQRDEK